MLHDLNILIHFGLVVGVYVWVAAGFYALVGALLAIMKQ